MVNSRVAKLRAMKRGVNKKHGAGTMLMSQKVIPMSRLSTRSLTYDVALGGGPPVGRIWMIHGKKSSGKTYTALSVAADAQSRCANCLRYVVIEDVIETGSDPETGEIEYAVVAKCDCYAKGLFKTRPFPEERESKAADGLKQIEIEIDDPSPKAKPGDKKKKKVKVYEQRLAALAENSYEEFRVAFLDPEKAFSPEWAEKVGIDMRRLVYDRPSTAEEASDTYDALLRTGSIDLVIIDSIAAMTPSKEVEASAEDEMVGVQARLINRMCRKTVSAMVDVWRDYGREVTQIWINQVRMKVNTGGFGSPETRPGGMGQEFVNSVEVKMWPNDWDEETVDDGMTKKDVMSMATTGRLNFKTEKNKTAPPRQIGSFVLDYKTGQIDQIGQVTALCERYGMLVKATKGGKWDFRGKEYQSKAAAVRELDKPLVWRTTYDALKRKMLEAR